MNLYYYNFIDKNEKRFLNEDEIKQFFNKCNLQKKFLCGLDTNSSTIEIINGDYVDDDCIFGMLYKNELIKEDPLHDLTFDGNKISEVIIKSSTFFIISNTGTMSIIQSSKTPSIKSPFRYLLHKILGLHNFEIAFVPSKDELLNELGNISRMTIRSGERCDKNVKNIGDLESIYNFGNGEIAEYKIDISLNRVDKKHIGTVLNSIADFSKEIIIFGESDDGDTILDYINNKVTRKKVINIDNLLEEKQENTKELIYKKIRENMIY